VGTRARFCTIAQRLGLYLWRGLTSDALLAGRLALWGVWALLGGILPQASGAGDALQAEATLGRGNALWGDVAKVLQPLSLFAMFNSRFFRVLRALVAAVALARLLALWVLPWAPPLPRRVQAVPLHLPADGRQAWARVRWALALAGQRVARRMTCEGTEYVLARRVGKGRWLAGLTYVGVLLLLLAGVVRARYGWQGPRLELAAGETQLLHRAKGLAVRLEELRIVPRPDGTLARLDSQLSLLQGATALRALNLGLGRSARYEGLALYQVGYGPAVRVRAQTAQGEVLALQRLVGDPAPGPALRVRFSGSQQEQLLAIPKADLVLRLVYYPTLPAQGLQRPTLHAQLLRGSDNQLVAEAFLSSGGQLSTPAAQVELQVEYFIILRAEREPELPVAAAGGALLLLGLVGWWSWSPREVWLALRSGPEGTVGQLILPAGHAQEPWATCLQHFLAEDADG
jgi:hypothetical protein